MEFLYETDRLVLRVLGEEDAGRVLDFYIDGDSYFGKVEPERSEGFYTWNYQRGVLKYEMDYFMSDKAARYYIFTKDNEDEIIGTVSVQNIVKSAFMSAQIGYKMLEKYTKKGYCSEAVSCITRKVFSDMGLHKLKAYVNQDNHESIRVLKRAGYEQEGIARDYVMIRGEWKDHLVFSCINSQN